MAGDSSKNKVTKTKPSAVVDTRTKAEKSAATRAANKRREEDENRQREAETTSKTTHTFVTTITDTFFPPEGRKSKHATMAQRRE